MAQLNNTLNLFMQQVKYLVWSRRNMKSKPDLSMEELAVIMALHRPHGVNAFKLHKMIICSLTYYLDVAVDASIRGQTSEMNSFISEFGSVFHQFEVPWTRSVNLSRLPSAYPLRIGDAVHNDDLTWTVDPNEAQIFLQQSLGYRKAHSDQAFPFQDLSQEIRDRILLMVLGLPKSGVSIEHDPPPRDQIRLRTAKARVVSRSFEDELDVGLWTLYVGGYPAWPNGQFCGAVLHCRPLVDMLAIFRVSKSTYEEATAVFFSQNTFVCQDIEHLVWFLSNMTTKARNKLRHLVLFLRAKNNGSPIAKALRLLHGCKGLQKLDIKLDEKDFLSRLVTKRGIPKYANLMDVPGMSSLTAIRGLKVVRFHGDCEDFAAKVEPLLRTPAEVSEE